jgi:hypothetical protein
MTASHVIRWGRASWIMSCLLLASPFCYLIADGALTRQLEEAVLAGTGQRGSRSSAPPPCMPASAALQCLRQER